MEKEIWKDAIGYEGLYQISNLGNIYSILSNKLLIPGISSNGYYTVSLKGKTHTLHRIVAMAFIYNTKNKKCVNHKDCNKLNNNVYNLEWVTYSENAKHAYLNKLRTSSFLGKKRGLNARSKKVVQLDMNLNFIKIHDSCVGASIDSNISKTGINNCCKNRSISSGGYIWINHEDYLIKRLML